MAPLEGVQAGGHRGLVVAGRGRQPGPRAGNHLLGHGGLAQRLPRQPLAQPRHERRRALSVPPARDRPRLLDCPAAKARRSPARHGRPARRRRRGRRHLVPRPEAHRRQRDRVDHGHAGRLRRSRCLHEPQRLPRHQPPAIGRDVGVLVPRARAREGVRRLRDAGPHREPARPAACAGAGREHPGLRGREDAHAPADRHEARADAGHDEPVSAWPLPAHADLRLPSRPRWHGLRRDARHARHSGRPQQAPQQGLVRTVVQPHDDGEGRGR
ncbi:hypothetical protein D3C86_1373970 [compost metagenome]